MNLVNEPEFEVMLEAREMTAIGVTREIISRVPAQDFYWRRVFIEMCV